jgi:uncharacterized protein DUF1257
MSHFTKVRTQLQDLDTVKRALIDLGYDVSVGKVRGYGGQTTTAPVVVKLSTGMEIGFQKDGKVVQLVADFWGQSLDRDQFVSQVTQRYAYLTVIDQAEKQGWQVMTDEVQQDGSVRLVMQRWS